MSLNLAATKIGKDPSGGPYLLRLLLLLHLVDHPADTGADQRARNGLALQATDASADHAAIKRLARAPGAGPHGGQEDERGDCVLHRGTSDRLARLDSRSAGEHVQRTGSRLEPTYRKTGNAACYFCRI